MSMADRDGFIWYDGKFVPWRDATTHVLTHTLHYGLGVFEGVRCYQTAAGPAIFRLRDHTDRLFAQRDRGEVTAVRKLAKGMRVEERPDSCYLRPLAFYGSEAMGVAVEPGSRHYRCVAMGCISGRRRTREGHSRQDLVIYPPPEHHDVQREGRVQCAVVWREGRTMATRKRCCSTRKGSSARVPARTFLVRDVSSTPDLPVAHNGITRGTIFTFAEELVSGHRRRITATGYIADGVHRHCGRGDADP